MLYNTKSSALIFPICALFSRGSSCQIQFGNFLIDKWVITGGPVCVRRPSEINLAAGLCLSRDNLVGPLEKSENWLEAAASLTLVDLHSAPTQSDQRVGKWERRACSLYLFIHWSDARIFYTSPRSRRASKPSHTIWCECITKATKAQLISRQNFLFLICEIWMKEKSSFCWSDVYLRGNDLNVVSFLIFIHLKRDSIFKHIF
jgi:hypothetical protein